MSNELHLLYLLTPIQLDFKVNWGLFRSILNKLGACEQKIAAAIGIDEEIIMMYESADHADSYSHKRHETLLDMRVVNQQSQTKDFAESNNA